MRRLAPICLLSLAAWLGLPSGVRAQMGDTVALIQAPPIDSVLAMALAAASGPAARRSEARAAELRLPALGGWPATELETRWARAEDDHRVRSTTRAFSVRQPWPWPGTLGARRAVGHAELEALRLGEDDARREIARAVYRDYAELYRTQWMRSALSDSRTLLRATADAARSRYESSQSGLAEVARAEQEIAHLDEELLDAEAERAAAAARLSEWLGAEAPNTIADGVPLWTVAALPSLPDPLASGTAGMLGEAPDARRARAAVRIAERRAALAEAEARPQFSIGADLSKEPPLDPEFGVSLGVDLPLFSRRATEKTSARASLDAARDDQRAATQRVSAEHQALAARWRWAEAQIVLHRERILPQDQTTFELTRDAFASGRADFRMLLESLRLWLEDRSHLADIEAERLSLWAELRLLSSDWPARTEEETP